ncbi:hypothetical protein DB30_05246 [Enhygromyxa salina]|uniref:Uncharacterized protein n=1 Tax=Enhygromyxa salina TaxID=215803 RepID=A0A0C1ZXH8_9BACT|nr:hypothetical protein [Enhygromyxa salina]KIG15828.1 hypothetical protein DB30_05246 [Enhygromyxa salina]
MHEIILARLLASPLLREPAPLTEAAVIERFGLVDDGDTMERDGSRWCVYWDEPAWHEEIVAQELAQTLMHQLVSSIEAPRGDGTTSDERLVMQAVSDGWRAALKDRFGAPETREQGWVAFAGRELLVSTSCTRVVANQLGDYRYVLATAVRNSG